MDKNYKQLIKTNVLEKARQTRHMYNTKYFDIFMNSLVFEGNIDDQQKHFVMKKLYADGKIACWPIKNTDMLGFAPFTEFEYNMYDFPEKIYLTNTRNVSTSIVPNKPMVVNKDVVIGYYSKSHKAPREIVNWYIDRIVQAEMVINTNIALQNIPFLIKANNKNIDKMKNIVNRILNNEMVLFADTDVLDDIDCLNTSAPYLIDKLYDYKLKIENELLTFLGVNNNPVNKQSGVTVEEVNSNNDFIDASDDVHTDEMRDFCKRVELVFNTSLTVRSKYDILSTESDDNSDKEDKEVSDND